MLRVRPRGRAALPAVATAAAHAGDFGRSAPVRGSLPGPGVCRTTKYAGPDSRKARNLRRDPRVAISLTPPDAPFPPVILRGRVVEWLDGEEGWRVVDEIATKYTGQRYGRDQERVVGLVDVEHQKIGL